MLFFATASGLFALDPAKDIFQYDCRSWNYQNGLPATSVRAVAQTKDGYLWLGTHKGLVRFDGVGFTLIGAPPVSELRNTSVQALRSSRSGGLWFGLEKSAYGFHAPDGGWRVGKDPQAGWDWDAACVLETSEGTLWVGGERAAQGSPNTLNLQRVFPQDPNLYVSSLAQDSKGRIWLGTANRGLFYWQNGESLAQFPDAALDSRIIYAIAVDNGGRIWLGTHVGLLCYDANFQPQTLAYPNYEVNCLMVDRHGVLWVGTSGNGLARCKDGVFTSLQKTDGLTSDSVLALAEDQEGSVWIGTSEGLNQLTDVKFQTYGTKDGIPVESALSVSASPQGGLWVGTTHSAVHWHNGRTISYSTNTGLADPYVKRVLESKNGDVFILSGYSMIEVMHGGKRVALHTTRDMPVAMTEDATGVIVSVAGELYRVSRERLELYEFVGRQKPQFYWILNLSPGRDGSFWVASVNGVCRIKDGEFRQWTKQDGLMDYNVRWVWEDTGGTVWLGMATGIACLRGDRVWNIRQQDGLLNANIWSIMPDDRGNLWVDTKIGLCRLNQKNLEQFFAGKASRVECVAYDGPEAVKPADKDRQENSACRTADGRIWFPNAKGVLVVDPANIPVNAIPPPVHVQRIRANGFDLSPTNQVTVAPGRGEAEFAYTALSYIAPQKTRFRYRLEGFDRDWVDAGDRRLAFYTNLKPGRYRFQVIAANADGVWNETGDMVDVRLLPHFAQTIWCKLLWGAAILAGLAGMYAWRMRRLRAKQMALYKAREVLEATVLERTASLQAEVKERLQAQTDLEAQKAKLENEIEERKRMQSEVERIHRQLVDTSRQIGQAEVASSVLHNVGNVLNSVNVSTELLADRLRALQLNILPMVSGLIKDHAHDLGNFLATHEKGRRLPQYLEDFSQHLSREREELLKEIKELADNVNHIKEIVAMQQSYAKVAGLQETLPAAELVESSLRIDAAAYERDGIKVIRDFEKVPPLTVDKHKVLQILVNVLRNARRACEDSGQVDKRVTLRVQCATDKTVRIAIADNGIGIPLEDRTKIFSHGFTTRKNGHGFGLHSSALAAREMGGALIAHSDGLGKGATFTLELPFKPVQ